MGMMMTRKRVAKQVPPTQKLKRVAKQMQRKVAKQVPPIQKPKRLATQMQKRVAKQVPPTLKPKRVTQKPKKKNLKTTRQSPKKSHLKMLIVVKLKTQTLAKRKKKMQQLAKRQLLALPVAPPLVPPPAHLAQALGHCVDISRIAKHLSKMTTKFVDFRNCCSRYCRDPWVEFRSYLKNISL